jgi:uncharacterized protein YbjT (DUF2867 family)
MMEGVPPQGGDIEVVYADVRDGTTVAQAVRDSDAVVNAVGLYVEHGEATFQAVHVDGAQEVARAAREAGIPRLVHLLRYRCRCEFRVLVRPLQGPR